jgi:hypothetical protein
LRRRWQSSSSSLATRLDSSTDEDQQQQRRRIFQHNHHHTATSNSIGEIVWKACGYVATEEPGIGDWKPTDPTGAIRASVKITNTSTTTTKTGSSKSSTSSTSKATKEHDDTSKMVDYRALAASLPEPPSTSDILKDRFDRQHTYLRISVSEKCNLRRTACPPKRAATRRRCLANSRNINATALPPPA